MAALFIPPLPFSAAATAPAPLAGSVANLNIDTSGLVWRFGLTTPYVIVDLGAGTLAYDTIAIVGSNLRASDTVQVRTGASNTGIGGYAGSAVAAWTGTKLDIETAITLIRLGATRTERYVRIDLAATSHPDGFVQFQRLVIGKAVATNGIGFDCEMVFEDRSEITTFLSGSSVDEGDVLTGWKFSTGWITDADWRANWYPLMKRFGQKKAILFIPYDSAPDQTDMVFGRLTSQAKGKSEFYNAWRVEGTITALSM